mmetsp:Transcript_21680/g.26674  ORF Transcript_21680/g.26674 Transcript_21680/m.26674 type:complete len:136 (+) Transcript_21680:1420-1827(+)
MAALSLMKGFEWYWTVGWMVIKTLTLIKLCLLPQPNVPRQGFYVMPYVPILPAIGIQFNFLLACSLDGLSWATFGIYLAVGLTIYFAYGMWHSRLNHVNPNEAAPLEDLAVGGTDESTFELNISGLTAEEDDAEG